MLENPDDEEYISENAKNLTLWGLRSLYDMEAKVPYYLRWVYDW